MSYFRLLEFIGVPEADDYEWMLRARCRGVDPAIMFPERGEDVGRALALCAECQVREECLGFAMTASRSKPTEVGGIWGGTTGRERDRMMKRLRRGLSDPVDRRPKSA